MNYAFPILKLLEGFQIKAFVSAMKVFNIYHDELMDNREIKEELTVYHYIFFNFTPYYTHL